MGAEPGGLQGPRGRWRGPERPQEWGPAARVPQGTHGGCQMAGSVGRGQGRVRNERTVHGRPAPPAPQGQSQWLPEIRPALRAPFPGAPPSGTGAKPPGSGHPSATLPEGDLQGQQQ